MNRHLCTLLLFCATCVYSTPVEITLQQGLNNYAGCVDTHMEFLADSINFSTSPVLIIENGGC